MRAVHCMNGDEYSLNYIGLHYLDLSGNSNPSACLNIYFVHGNLTEIINMEFMCALGGGVFYFNLEDYVEKLDTLFKNTHNCATLRQFVYFYNQNSVFYIVQIQCKYYFLFCSFHLKSYNLVLLTQFMVYFYIISLLGRVCKK